MEQIDYNDTKALWAFSLESIRIAEEYQKSRREYAGALKFLRVSLVRAYRDGKINTKHTEGKAFMIIAGLDPQCAAHLNILTENEHEFKAWEKVLAARESALSFNQSLIKNKIAERG